VLVIAYHLLETGQPYSDLGAGYFDQIGAERIQGHHVKRLQQLGHEVTLTRGDLHLGAGLGADHHQGGDVASGGAGISEEPP